MPDYRRAMVPGGIFFFTVVTFDRRLILIPDLSHQSLRRAWKAVQENHPFKCDAIPPWADYQSTCILYGHYRRMIQIMPEADALRRIIPFAGQP